MITSLDICRRTGLSYRRVDHWTRAGLLTAYDTTPGSGNVREYPDDQMRLAAEMARLTAAGLPPVVAHAAAVQILDVGAARLGEYVLAPAVDVPIPYVPADEVAARRESHG